MAGDEITANMFI